MSGLFLILRLFNISLHNKSYVFVVVVINIGKYVVDGNDLNTKKMKPIQLEIQYCPGIEWIAYDISYRIEEDCDSQGLFSVENPTIVNFFLAGWMSSPV